MGNLLQTHEVVARVERLVDLLEIRSDWNRGRFDGCVYEHMLPVMDSAYRHFVKPLTRSGELAERRQLERSVNEVFGRNSRGFSLAPPHQVMMTLVQDYVVYGRRLEYPIDEWTKEELFSEYDHSYYWSGVWGIVATAVAAADFSAIIVTAAATIVGATTVVRAAGAIGIAATLAGAAAAYLTYRHYTRQRDRIREEIADRIDDGRIDASEWDAVDLEVRRKYNG